jgi:hypothetical protein
MSLRWLGIAAILAGLAWVIDNVPNARRRTKADGQGTEHLGQGIGLAHTLPWDKGDSDGSARMDDSWLLKVSSLPPLAVPPKLLSDETDLPGTEALPGLSQNKTSETFLVVINQSAPIREKPPSCLKKEAWQVHFENSWIPPSLMGPSW